MGDPRPERADRRQPARAQDLVLGHLQLGGAVLDALLQLGVPGADLLVAPADLAGHLVEALGELAELVAGIDLDRLVVPALGESAHALRELAHRLREASRQQRAEERREQEGDRRPENRVVAHAHRAAEGRAGRLSDADCPAHPSHRRRGRQPFRLVGTPDEPRQRCARGHHRARELALVGRQLGEAGERDAALAGEKRRPRQLRKARRDLLERHLRGQEAHTVEAQRDGQPRSPGRSAVRQPQGGAGLLRERQGSVPEQRLQVGVGERVGLLRVGFVHGGREQLAVVAEERHRPDRRQLPVRDAQHGGQLGVGKLGERERADREAQPVDRAGHRALHVARRLGRDRDLGAAHGALHLGAVERERQPSQERHRQHAGQGKEGEEPGAKRHRGRSPKSAPTVHPSAHRL